MNQLLHEDFDLFETVGGMGEGLVQQAFGQGEVAQEVGDVGFFAGHVLDAAIMARDRRHKWLRLLGQPLALSIVARVSSGIILGRIYATALRTGLRSKSLIMNACLDRKPVLMLPCEMGRRGALILTLHCSTINLDLAADAETLRDPPPAVGQRQP